MVNARSSHFGRWFEFFGVRVSKCTKCSTALLDCDLTKLGVRGRCKGTPFDPGTFGYYFVDGDHNT